MNTRRNNPTRTPEQVAAFKARNLANNANPPVITITARKQRSQSQRRTIQDLLRETEGMLKAARKAGNVAAASNVLDYRARLIASL